MYLLFSCLIAFTVTILCLKMLRTVAIHIKLVDTPGGRKHHQGDIPLIGGIAMFCGFLIALLTLSISLASFRSFLTSCAILIFVGVLDDLHELSARSRFIAQILAAIIAASWGKILLVHLGNLVFFKDIFLNGWSFPFTIFAFVGGINAVNMLDGLDGLAGGSSFIELIFLFILAYVYQPTEPFIILAILIVVVLAFLIFNFPFTQQSRAKIFMGDTGSMFLGFALVWFSIQLSQIPSHAIAPVTMLWILALPLFDIIGVMLRRIQKRTSVFSPDREHLHHILEDCGLTKPQVTWTLCGVATTCGAIGVISNFLHIAESTMFCSFIALFLCYLGILNFYRKKFHKS